MRTEDIVGICISVVFGLPIVVLVWFLLITGITDEIKKRKARK